MGWMWNDRHPCRCYMLLFIHPSGLWRLWWDNANKKIIFTSNHSVHWCNRSVGIFNDVGCRVTSLGDFGDYIWLQTI